MQLQNVNSTTEIPLDSERVTRWLVSWEDAGDNSHGALTNRQWCVAEARRLEAKGFSARVVELGSRVAVFKGRVLRRRLG